MIISQQRSREYIHRRTCNRRKYLRLVENNFFYKGNDIHIYVASLYLNKSEMIQCYPRWVFSLCMMFGLGSVLESYECRNDIAKRKVS